MTRYPLDTEAGQIYPGAPDARLGSAFRNKRVQGMIIDRQDLESYKISTAVGTSRARSKGTLPLSAGGHPASYDA